MTTWLPELLNFAACSVLAGYMFAIAVLMPSRGLWPQRVVVWSLTISLGLQLAAPWSELLVKTSWNSAILHCAFAATLLIWHREAMAFIRCRFTVPAARDRHHRRVTDWAPSRAGFPLED